MARETKKDRIVAKMFDQLSEHLHELKVASQNAAFKESDLERWAQSVIKNVLGYSASEGYLIVAQETKAKMRPDLTVKKNDKAVFVVEVKKLDFDLNKSDFRSGKVQLSEYLKLIGDVHWGILTNGYEWKLFDFSQVNSGIEIVSFDIRNDADEIDLSKKAIEEMCWEFLDLHENTFLTNEWEEYSKEAVAFSPESLAQAILSYDSIKYISKAIRGEHDYKVNPEILFDKIHSLLVNGLDDSVVGWNEVKEAELKKYVTSQKKASRKKKTSPKKQETSTNTPPSSSEETIQDQASSNEDVKLN